MGRQVRFYLVPADIEMLVAELRARHGVKLIDLQSDGPSPTEIGSPFREFPADPVIQRHVSVHCYLLPPSEARIRMWYIPNLEKWSISDEGSEVIQFSGCAYDGTFLKAGRFYFLPNILVGDSIWPQRKEFADCADKVFRTAKKLMRYSKAMEAYVGPKRR